jgi:hypothetical protein
MIKIKQNMTSIKRLLKMNVNQEEIKKLSFSLNNFIENKSCIVDITINNKSLKIKRSDDLYFIEDYGWTSAFGIYCKITNKYD